MERSVLTGLAVFRWAGWVWMATVLALARRSLRAAPVAVALVAAALVVTVVATVWLRRSPERVLAPGFVWTELTVAAGLLLADGFVYETGHVFSTEQSLGVAWPLAGVLAAGVALGRRAGALAGLVLGLCRALSSTVNAPETLPAGTEPLVAGLAPEWVLSLVTTTVLYVLAGAVAGHASRLLLRAEQQISAARARAQLARRLHDGVLQTLALVERQTDDERLARLAREQERELRDFLFGDPTAELVGRSDLGDRLRTAAGRFEERHGGRVRVLVPEDLPDLDGQTVDALAGAVGEALTNAGRHGGADTVTVFLEPTEDEGVFCSVRDDGSGFDPERTPEGVGLRESVRGRIHEVGGTVELSAAPGRGAEITMTVPGR